jgi:hypothetical protein
MCVVQATKGQRKLHDKELHNLYSSVNNVMIKSKPIRCAGHATREGEMKTEHRNEIETPERKKPLGRPRLTWKDNIKMVLTQRGCEAVAWWQGRYVRRRAVPQTFSTWMNLRVLF